MDSYKGLDYRQKAQLESAIEDTLNGNLKKLSSEIRTNPELWNAYADALHKMTGATVVIDQDPLYHSPQMTISKPGSNESIVFAWQGGMAPVYAMKDGKKYTLDQSENGNEYAVNSTFSDIVRKGRQDYMMPSMLR